MNDTKLTRGGVVYDFKVSPFKLVVNYDIDDSILYTFSSQFNIDRFNERRDENRKTINNSLSKRFNITFKNDKLCDIKLYSTIEKRGFLIEDRKERYECLNNIILDGMNLTTRN